MLIWGSEEDEPGHAWVEHLAASVLTSLMSCAAPCTMASAPFTTGASTSDCRGPQRGTAQHSTAQRRVLVWTAARAEASRRQAGWQAREHSSVAPTAAHMHEVRPGLPRMCPCPCTCTEFHACHSATQGGGAVERNGALPRAGDSLSPPGWSCRRPAWWCAGRCSSWRPAQPPPSGPSPWGSDPTGGQGSQKRARVT